MSVTLDRLKELTDRLTTYEIQRRNNLNRLSILFEQLGLTSKINHFEALFEFKAMNLTGISLKEEHLGAIQHGKYVQILAIGARTEKKASNSSLVYLGKAEKLTPLQCHEVVEFVLRWRFEKSMRTVHHYESLLATWSYHA